jgi:serine/threonine-protein kinase
MTLAHYRLDRKIGAGGMGEVWRATDSALDRAAKLLAALHHPGIAGIHGLHREGNVSFLAMELVEGEDLAQRARTRSRRVVENWFEEFRAR